jgi:hypothetical protein
MGHKYAISWTTRRTTPESSGGHFFISKYGIRIKAAANTLIVWRPQEWHGTSLQERGPTEDTPVFQQSGLAIITIPRLPELWKKYISTSGDQLEQERIAAAETEIAADEVE